MGIKQTLKQAVFDALKDRSSLLDAYAGCDDEMIEDIKKQISKIKSWKYKPSSAWTTEDRKTVFNILIYAEQHQEGWAAANNCSPEIKEEALKQLKVYKNYRIANMGKSQLESILEDPSVKTIEVSEIVKNPNKLKGIGR